MAAKRLLTAGLLALTFVGALVSTVPAAAKPSAHVLPPTAKVGGLSNGEWAARWWQWSFSIPIGESPLYDLTGEKAAVGQVGHVWFLAGVFINSGTAVRDITIPSGKHLFMPILNHIYSKQLCPAPGDDIITIPEMRAIIKASMDAATDLAFEIDGQSLEDVRSHRVQSPVFPITIPVDNIFACGDPAGTYYPQVDDGYYVMLPPLSVGEHVIHFHGAIPGFTLDITYNVTVVPAGRYQKP